MTRKSMHQTSIAGKALQARAQRGMLRAAFANDNDRNSTPSVV